MIEELPNQQLDKHVQGGSTHGDGGDAPEILRDPSGASEVESDNRATLGSGWNRGFLGQFKDEAIPDHSGEGSLVLGD